MSRVILVAESGSDIPPGLARKYGIYIVPMHVAFGEKTVDDGAFPSEEICAYYERTGTLPTTSGCSPEDFAAVFRDVHAAHPDARILHLAYSAITTVSFQSAKLAAEGLDYVTSVDTKHVTIGQASIVLSVAEQLAAHPEMSLQKAVSLAEDYCKRARMCFIPDDLEYLRAGGRISNVVYYLGGQLLHLHPRVELLDGKLIATKKYRGKMVNTVKTLIHEYTAENHLEKDRLWLLCTPGLSKEIRQAADRAARECGFAEVVWLKSGGVITTHSGPGAIGVAGFAEK